MSHKLPKTECNIPMPNTKPCAKECKKCGGTGFVQIAPNVRGILKCPCCGGWGKLKQQL